MKKLLLLLAIIITCQSALPQQDISKLSWKKVATGMPDSWYGSDESVRVAENVLLYQRNAGGWPKNIEKHRVLTDEQKKAILKEKENQDAIFDNSATTTEMRFLALMFNKTGNNSYRESFNKGLKFILDAQYPNGGWPMFWPLRKGYYTHITFNDDAIINILKLLRDINSGKPLFIKITDDKLKASCTGAFDRGIECILNTQIVVKGEPTVWCAQHDENTLEPAKARAYELPSFSGGESAGIVSFLMELPSPGARVVAAIEGAIKWFEANKIPGIRIEDFTSADGIRDRRVVNDPSSGPLWARFYDLATGKPFFCDRDGIKKNNLSEIGYERRNGYSWYTDAPLEALKKYQTWKNTVKTK
ncbi:MAG: pectate lyase [Bacteroidales bacterium]